jgi:hypothetical protein
VVLIAPDTSGADFLVPLLLFGFGMGLLISQLVELVQSSAPAELVDAAAGVSKATSNLGASFGTAIAGAVIITTLAGTYRDLVDSSTVLPDAAKASVDEALQDAGSAVSNEQVEAAARSAGASQDVQDEVVRINAEANVVALRRAIAVLTSLGLVSFVTLSLVVRRRRRRPVVVPA